MGSLKAHICSDLEIFDADYLCQSIPNLQRVESELQQLAKLRSIQMPYRSEARPKAALNPTSFTQSIAYTLSQMYQNRPHVFYLT